MTPQDFQYGCRPWHLDCHRLMVLALWFPPHSWTDPSIYFKMLPYKLIITIIFLYIFQAKRDTNNDEGKQSISVKRSAEDNKVSLWLYIWIASDKLNMLITFSDTSFNHMYLHFECSPLNFGKQDACNAWWIHCPTRWLLTLHDIVKLKTSLKSRMADGTKPKRIFLSLYLIILFLSVCRPLKGIIIIIIIIQQPLINIVEIDSYRAFWNKHLEKFSNNWNACNAMSLWCFSLTIYNSYFSIYGKTCKCYWSSRKVTGFGLWDQP